MWRLSSHAPHHGERVSICQTMAGRQTVDRRLPLLDPFRPGSAKSQAIAGQSSQAACQSRRPLTGGAGSNENTADSRMLARSRRGEFSPIERRTVGRADWFTVVNLSTN
jgi:hypothetical protein